MRLTLRTLLAYLDDTLPPAETRLIGQKVAESPAARALIDRIKEVVRRRRLTTPPATGPGAKADANTIAEYIDNVLPPEQLAEIEEVCLGSDVHLAEIAACHQVLTVVLSEPVLVPPTAKRRMYGLVRGRESIPYRKVSAPSLAESALPDHADVTDETLLLGLPLYRRQGPWYLRLMPLLGVLLLCVALVAALAFSLGGFWPHRQTPTAAVVANDELTHVVVPPEPTPAPSSDGKHQDDKHENGKALAEDGGGAAQIPANLPHRAGKENETSPPAKGNAAPAPEVSTKPQAPPKPTGPAEIGAFSPTQDAPSLLAVRPPKSDTWTRARPGTRVSTGDALVSLPGYQSLVALDNGMQLLLWGNLPKPTVYPVMESSVLVNQNTDCDLDVTLRSGRILVSSKRPGGIGRFRVRFLKEVWDVTLDAPNTEVYVELWNFYDAGVSFKDPVGPHAKVALLIMKGEAIVKVGYDTYRMRQPPGRAGYFWDNMGAVEFKPQTMSQIPAWLSRRPPQDKEGLALAALEKRLQGPEPLDTSLENVVRDSDAPLRDLAVLCMGAVDDVPGLLDALGSDRGADIRVGAITTLRNWMARDAGQDVRLDSAMEKKWGKGQAAIAMELLHAYSAERLQDSGLWESLIAYLTNDNLAIRELANVQLISIRPDLARTMPAYDLAGPPEQRQVAYREWKKRIPDGKLPPPPAKDKQKSQDSDKGR